MIARNAYVQLNKIVNSRNSKSVCAREVMLCVCLFLSASRVLYSECLNRARSNATSIASRWNTGRYSPPAWPPYDLCSSIKSTRLEQAVETTTAGKTSAETGEQASSAATTLLLLLRIHALWRRSLLVVHLLLRRAILALRWAVARALLVWGGRAVVARGRLVVVALLVAAVGLLGI